MNKVAILFVLMVFSCPARASDSVGSATIAVDSGLSMPIQLSTRSIKVGVTPSLDLTLPDGDTRIMVENKVGGRTWKVGTRYNFIFGKIRYWASYGLPVYRDLVNFESAISDDIGFGRIYYDTKFLERARTGLAGLRFSIGGAAVFLSTGRTDWHLSPFDNPAMEDSGNIDAISLEVVSTSDFSVIPESQEPDVSRIRYRRAFRGLGGDWHFDKLEADANWSIPALRGSDEAVVRALLGQSWNNAPSLPLRETFALGGASALKGYRYEEYRGTGVLLGGLEYGINLPFHIEVTRLRTGLTRNHFLVFGEVGRTEHDWLRPDMGFKKSAGAGFRLRGHWGDRKIHLRFYGAQAIEAGTRAPVWYLMLDLK